MYNEDLDSMGFDTSEFNVNDLETFLQCLDSYRRKLLSEISTLGKLQPMSLVKGCFQL